MTQNELAYRVTKLEDSLAIIEQEMQRGDAAEETLEDFKVAVDNVRTGILAILSATRSDDYAYALARFRLKRATQLSQNVLSDFVLGTVRPDSTHLSRFRAAAFKAYERIDVLCGNGLRRLRGPRGVGPRITVRVR